MSIPMRQTEKASKNRLKSETVSIRLGVDNSGLGHDLDVSLAYDQITARLREVIFVGRGKIGHGMDDMFRELGIKLSRAIQGRDPETGKRGFTE